MTNALNVNRTKYGTLQTTSRYNNGQGPKIAFSSSQNVAETLVNTRSGGNTPGYHDPKRVGVLKPTSFSFNKSYATGELGYDFHHDTRYGPNQTGYSYTETIGCFGPASVPGHVGVTQAEIDRLSTSASNGVLSKIKSQSVNVAQALAESHQTARLIGNTAVRLAGSIVALRKGDFMGAAAKLGIKKPPKRANARFRKAFPRTQGEAVARGWLELQYGWLPLLNDVYGAAEQLAKAQNRPPVQVVKKRARSVVPIFYNKVTKQFPSYTGQSLRYGEAKAEVTYKIMYLISSPTQASAKEIGLTNPLLIAWELLPFSFVADWFIPLGSYIGNFDATRGCTFVSGSKTVFQSVTSQSSVSQSGIDQYSIEYNSFRSQVSSDVKVDRTVLTGFPSVVFPSFKNPASFTHAANAIALLTQLFRNK